MGSIAGPLDQYDLPGGEKFPFYVIKFDKEGLCVTPQTRASLADALRNGAYTDLYLFSHGWNNTPKDAIETYRRWIKGYQSLRALGAYAIDRPYRPVLAGVVWPSVWIVPWWERGPKIAGGVPVEDEREDAMVRELAEYVPAGKRERFYALTQAAQLDEDEAREFITMLRSLHGDGDDDIGEAEGPTVDGLLASWARLGRSGGETAFVPEEDDAAVVVGTAGPTLTEPEAAGRIGRAPVDGVRLFSVWQMKDRAATVGGNGVAVLLRDLMAASAGRPDRPAARTHLIGHSFGAKVLLSAICNPGDLDRPVSSLLLLQPAINQYGLADHVPHRAGPGGYHPALARVSQPILSTFSNRDVPLRTFFHLALQRDEDLGEAQIAGDEPPSDYAAMGG
jgi:hypothetical protein